MVLVRASEKSRGVIICHFYNKVSRCVWLHGEEYRTVAGAMKTFNYLPQQDGQRWAVPGWCSGSLMTFSLSPLSSSSCSFWSLAYCFVVAKWLLQLQASSYITVFKASSEEGIMIGNSPDFYQEAKHFPEAPKQTSPCISLASVRAHGLLQQQGLDQS